MRVRQSTISLLKLARTSCLTGPVCSRCAKICCNVHWFITAASWSVEKATSRCALSWGWRIIALGGSSKKSNRLSEPWRRTRKRPGFKQDWLRKTPTTSSNGKLWPRHSTPRPEPWANSSDGMRLTKSFSARSNFARAWPTMHRRPRRTFPNTGGRWPTRT